MIRKRKAKHAERIEKLGLQINLTEKTRDYNLGTSLRNYIDPRIFKTWTDEVGAEWEKAVHVSTAEKISLGKKYQRKMEPDFKRILTFFCFPFLLS